MSDSKKRVKYVGPSRRVVVVLPDGAEAVCDRDKSIAVPKALADNLLEQESNWQAAGGKVGDDVALEDAKVVKEKK